MRALTRSLTEKKRKKRLAGGYEPRELGLVGGVARAPAAGPLSRARYFTGFTALLRICCCSSRPHTLVALVSTTAGVSPALTH
jgi:hypothetical protein